MEDIVQGLTDEHIDKSKAFPQNDGSDEISEGPKEVIVQGLTDEHIDKSKDFPQNDGSDEISEEPMEDIVQGLTDEHIDKSKDFRHDSRLYDISPGLKAKENISQYIKIGIKRKRNRTVSDDEDDSIVIPYSNDSDQSDGILHGLKANENISQSIEREIKRKRNRIISDDEDDSIVISYSNDSDQSDGISQGLKAKENISQSIEREIKRKRNRIISDDEDDSIVIPDSGDSDQSELFPMLSGKLSNEVLDEKRNAWIATDIKNKNIYVSVKRSNNGKRVYDARHPCPFCPKIVINFSHHILSKQHEEEEEVQNILQKEGKERKALFAKLRLRAAHKKNMEDLKERKGEIFLLRRSSNNDCGSDTEDEGDHVQYNIDLEKYGPCPKCFGWVLLSSIKRHQSKCCAIDGTFSTKSSLIVQSDIIVGKIPEEASQMLTKEVFPIMQLDNVTKVAKGDSLIINLGNQWMMRNRGNEINRKYYTVMRLNAKLKLACQELSKTKEDLEHYLQPRYFDTVLKGALKCCDFDELDEDDLKAPSNAIKLGYDLKRMIDAKLAKAIINEDEKKKKESENFRKLMDIQWSLRVTKLAISLLNQRTFNVTRRLPLPSDIQKLATYLQNELRKVNVDDASYENFRKTACLTVVRITLFNRRRCHEVQAMKISSYYSRKTGVDEIGLQLRGELTEFECLLLERQDMVVIRGKALNTTENERQWVLDHMGHTMNVHKIHYRHTSDILERIDVAKILLLQDMGQIGKYHGKRLQDIQIEELLQDVPSGSSAVGAADVQDEVVELAPTMILPVSGGDDEDYIPDLNEYRLEEEEEDEDMDIRENKPKKKKPASTRQQWSKEEVEELNNLFKVNIEKLKLPGQQLIEAKMRVSLKNDGVIHKRKRDNIKKKLSNMLIHIKRYGINKTKKA